MKKLNYKDEKIANLILSLKKLKGVGNKSIQKFLIDKKEEIKAVDEYNESWLRSLDNKQISKGLDISSISWKEIQKQSSKILEIAYNQDIHVTHPFMENYAKRLLNLNYYPVILFGKGNIKLLNSEKSVAIIGTRNPTNLGEKLGIRLSRQLAKENYTIVSGLAVGCDTLAHKGALEVGGKTIAILPTPIDSNVYPKENQKLADEILEKDGLLVSEYSPGVVLHGRELVSNLIARDEWQPGLSDGLIVIETGLKGGSNHAIRHTINTNKPLGAIDYEVILKEKFKEDVNYAGNIKYIQKNEASPINDSTSIELFKNQLLTSQKKIMCEYSQKFKKIETNKDFTFEQMNFFD